MTDGGTKPGITISHVEAAHFRTVFANGAVFTGPADSSKTWLLTFYSEGVRIESESLVPAPDIEGAYRPASPPKIDVERIRRDEVCVIIPEHQLKAMLAAIASSMKDDK